MTKRIIRYTYNDILYIICPFCKAKNYCFGGFQNHCEHYKKHDYNWKTFPNDGMRVFFEAKQ